MSKLNKLANKVERFLRDFGVNTELEEVEKDKMFKKFQRGIQRAIVWQIERVTGNEFYDRVMQVSKMEKYKASDNRKLAQVLDAIYGRLRLDTAFSNVEDQGLGVFLRWGANRGGQAALNKLGIKAVFGVVNPDWIKFLMDAENLLISSVDATTKRWIAGIIQEGIDNKLTNLEVRDLLLTEIKGMAKVRAETIALTEIANVMGQTELESYKRAGLREKRWKTSRDERVCPICAPLDNMVVRTEAVFENVVKGVQYITQAPPIHPRCRCFLQAVEDETWIVGGKRVWLGD